MIFPHIGGRYPWSRGAEKQTDDSPNTDDVSCFKTASHQLVSLCT